MHRRQTGDLDCNLARLKIVFDVAATLKLVNQIHSTYVLQLGNKILSGLTDR